MSKGDLALSLSAKPLVQALDRRYEAFTESLPLPLRKLARLKRVFVSASGDEPFASMADINPLIACTAWLFRETFPELSEERFLDIAEGGAYLALASGVMDKLVDGQAEEPEWFALFHQAIFEQGSTCFRKLFPQTSPFWAQFDRLTADYWTSLATELDCQSKPENLTFDTFARITGGKVSPMVVAVAAMTESSGRPEQLAPIEESFRCTYVAGQIHDDILDWGADVRVHHLTYVVAALLHPEEWKDQRWPSHSEFLAENEAKWVDVELFNRAREWYDRALTSVEGLECPRWKEYLREYRGHAEQDQKIALVRHFKRVFSDIAVQ